jgi:hypothetical protein
MTNGTGGRARVAPFSVGAELWPGLAKVWEESLEVATVAAKLVARGGDGHGFDGSDLRQRLVEELGDVRAAICYLVDANLLDAEAVRAREQVKLAALWEAHDLAVAGHVVVGGHVEAAS